MYVSIDDTVANGRLGESSVEQFFFAGQGDAEIPDSLVESKPNTTSADCDISWLVGTWCFWMNDIFR